MRQWSLLHLREELKHRGITTETFQAKYADVTKLMRHSHFSPIAQSVSNGLSVKCVVLKGFRGLLHWQTQTDTYFSKEISDRVRVIACLTTLPNIMHSDSQSEFIPSSEWANLKKFVGSAENDTLVLVWGNYQDTETAANEVIIRAKEATIGIPNETRQALEDGTTGFERILPGPQRMYPDTDLPPIVLMQERVEKIRNNLPVPFWEKKNHYISIGIDEISAEKLAISKYSDLFEKIIKELKIDAKLASEIFIIFPKKLRKKDINFDAINPDDLFEILKHFANPHNVGEIKDADGAGCGEDRGRPGYRKPEGDRGGTMSPRISMPQDAVAAFCKNGKLPSSHSSAQCYATISDPTAMWMYWWCSQTVCVGTLGTCKR